MNQSKNNIIEAEHLFRKKSLQKSQQKKAKEPPILTEEQIEEQVQRQLENFDYRKWQKQIIGSPEFIRQVVEAHLRERARPKRYRAENVTLEKIQAEVEKYYNLEKNTILSTERIEGRKSARELFSHVAQEYEFTNADVARYLKVSASLVSKFLSTLYSNEKQAKRVKEITERLSKK